MPKYDHAGSRDGVIRYQTVLWSGPAVPPSPRSPGPYTWSLRWPALGPTLNVALGVSEWLPTPFCLGWAWAGPGWPREVGVAPPPPTATLGDPHGVKMSSNMSSPGGPVAARQWLSKRCTRLGAMPSGKRIRSRFECSWRTSLGALRAPEIKEGSLPGDYKVRGI